MNNIAQHFATAYLGMHLKGDATLQRYLELLPRSSDGVWAMESDGTKKPGHTYWRASRIAPLRAFAGRRSRRHRSDDTRSGLNRSENATHLRHSVDALLLARGHRLDVEESASHL